MTTMRAYYLVAYPHTSIRPLDHIERLKLDSDADRETVLGRPGPRDSYPDHSEDSEDATIWKVSRLAVAQLPL